jgi:hypothetical protein
VPEPISIPVLVPASMSQPEPVALVIAPAPVSVPQPTPVVPVMVPVPEPKATPAKKVGMRTVMMEAGTPVAPRPRRKPAAATPASTASPGTSASPVVAPAVTAVTPAAAAVATDAHALNFQPPATQSYGYSQDAYGSAAYQPYSQTAADPPSDRVARYGDAHAQGKRHDLGLGLGQRHDLARSRAPYRSYNQLVWDYSNRTDVEEPWLPEPGSGYDEQDPRRPYEHSDYHAQQLQLQRQSSSSPAISELSDSIVSTSTYDSARENRRWRYGSSSNNNPGSYSNGRRGGREVYNQQVDYRYEIPQEHAGSESAGGAGVAQYSEEQGYGQQQQYGQQQRYEEPSTQEQYYYYSQNPGSGSAGQEYELTASTIPPPRGMGPETAQSQSRLLLQCTGLPAPPVSTPRNRRTLRAPIWSATCRSGANFSRMRLFSMRIV